MQMDNLLPDWLEKGVESSLRDSEDDKPVAPVITAISSSPAGQRTKTMVSPVVLTPTAGSRPDSRQDSNKGTFAQDLESFYADAASSEEEESDEGDEDSPSEEEEEDVEEGEVGDQEVVGVEGGSESVEEDEDEDDSVGGHSEVNSVISK